MHSRSPVTADLVYPALTCCADKAHRRLDPPLARPNRLSQGEHKEPLVTLMSARGSKMSFMSDKGHRFNVESVSPKREGPIKEIPVTVSDAHTTTT